LQEAIGRLLDLTNRHMFFTDLGGSPYAAVKQYSWCSFAGFLRASM
jgi:hypothetical protein